MAWSSAGPCSGRRAGNTAARYHVASQLQRACCWAAGALLVAVQIAHAQAPTAEFPGESVNLTYELGFRAVKLSWVQQNNPAFGQGAWNSGVQPKYVIYNAGQVALDDPEVTSHETIVPCGFQNLQSCSALRLTAELQGLTLGQFCEFTVGSIYSDRSGVNPVAGKMSGAVRLLVTDPPGPPRNLTAESKSTGIKVSWQPPENTGLGSIWSVFYSNSSEVLRGYKLLISTSTHYEPTACADGPSQSCYTSTLAGWETEVSVVGLLGHAVYNVWLLAYNAASDGTVATISSFILRGLPPAPLHTSLVLLDHLVLRLDWQQPGSPGEEVALGIDYYAVEWKQGHADFSTCREDSGLQCYSTKDVALPGGCRECAVQTCNAGDVCFSSEVVSEDGVRFLVLGCTSAQNQRSSGDGKCGAPFSASYSHCTFCNTSRCNNVAPSASPGWKHPSCPRSDTGPYCLREVSSRSVVIAAAGPGEAFATRVVADEACQASMQVHRHDVPSSTLKLAVGSSAFSSGDVIDSLSDGATYYFRVAACSNDLGCGKFSEPLSATARRLVMAAEIHQRSKIVGMRTDVDISIRPIKGLNESGKIVITFPDEYTIDEQVAMADLGSLCSRETQLPSPVSAEHGDVDVVSSSGGSEVLCMVDGAYAGVVRTVVLGNEVTVQLAQNFRAAPNHPLAFRLQGILNPPLSGPVSPARISTVTAKGVLIDEALQVSGPELVPGDLHVSAVLSTTSAGQYSQANIVISSPSGFYAGNFTLMTDGDFCFTHAALYDGGGQLLRIAEGGRDFISISILEPVPDESLGFTLSGVLNGPVVGKTGDWRAYTHLHGVKMLKNDSVPAVKITPGSLLLDFMEEWRALPFGSSLNLQTRYMHSRDLQGMPGVAILRIEFPITWDLGDVRIEIKGDAGNSDFQEYSFVEHTIKRNFENSSVLEVTFGDDRVDSIGKEEPEQWVIRLLGATIPRFMRPPLESDSIRAQTISRFLGSDGHTDTVANMTTMVITYMPGVMSDVSAALSSSDAGALANLLVRFKLINSIPKQAMLVVESSAYVKMCHGGCEVLFDNILDPIAGAVSYTVESETKMLIRLDLEQEVASESAFRLQVTGVRNLPWAGDMFFKVSLVDAISQETIEQALDIAPIHIRSAALESVACVLAESSSDRFGKSDSTRPVLAASGYVQMGISFVPPVDIPCDSFIIVRVEGVRIAEVQTHTFYAHVQGTADYVASETPEGALMLRQTRSSSSLTCVKAFDFVSFKFKVRVSVTTGSLSGVARDYTIEVHQTRVDTSLAALFTGSFSDTLLVSSPALTGSRRLLEHSATHSPFNVGQAVDNAGAVLGVNLLLPQGTGCNTTSSTSSCEMWGLSDARVSLSSDLAGDRVNVTVSFQLLTDLSSRGSFVVNLPVDAELEIDSKVEENGMNGSLLVNMSTSSNSLILSRNEHDSMNLLYGQTQTSCTTINGSAPHGSACVFPFVYFGATFDSCTTVDNDGVLWCSTTSSFNGIWGNCACTHDEIDLNISITIHRVRLPTYSGAIKFQLLVVDRLGSADYVVAQDVNIPAMLQPNALQHLNVTLNPPQAGARANLTVKMILFNPLPSGGIVQVLFPAHFTCSPPAQISTLDGDLMNVSFAGHVMNLSFGLMTSELESEVVFDVPDVEVREWSGDVKFEVRTLMGPDLKHVVANFASDIVRIFPNDLLDVTVDLTSTVAGSQAAASIRFRPANDVPLHGGIHITLPVSFELDDPSLKTSWKLCGVVGAANITLQNIHIDKNFENILIDKNLATGRWQVLMMLSEGQMLSKHSLVEFTIPGVVVRPYSGLSGAFAIRTVTGALNVIDHALKGTETLIIPGRLAAVSVMVLSAEAGAVSSVQISFTNVNPIPADGKISVTFPSKFDLLNPVSNGYQEGIAGMVAVASYAPSHGGRCPVGSMAQFGCNVTLQVEGDETPSHSSVSFGITNVGMMQLAGFAGTYVVQTRTMDGFIIDEATVADGSVGPSKLGFARVEPLGVLRASSNATLKVSFTTANPVANGSFVHVVFSPLFNLSDTCYSDGVCGQLEVSGSGLSLHDVMLDRVLILVNQDCPAEFDLEFFVAGIKAPAVGGFTGTYQIKTVSAGGVDIDVDMDVEQIIAAPAVMQAHVVMDSTAAGAITRVHVRINVTSPIPAEDAIIELEVPSDASVTIGAAVTDISGLDGRLEMRTAGATIVLERKDAVNFVPAGAMISFDVTGVANPPREGSFGYILRSKRSIPSRTVSGLSSDSGSIIRVLDEATVSVIIDPAPLGDAGFFPYPLSVGYRGPVRVRFRTANFLPADGIIRLSFSDDLVNLTSVLTSTVMAATMQEAQVTFVNGTTCTSADESSVTVSRTSGSTVGAGIMVDVEITLVQILGFVNRRGYVNVSTSTSTGVVIDSERVPVHVSDAGVLAQAQAQVTGCRALVSCFGNCGCNASPDVRDGVTSGNISVDVESESNKLCTWIIASECGELKFRFKSFRLRPENADPTQDEVKLYECSDMTCSSNSELVSLKGTLDQSDLITVYSPSSGVLKIVFQRGISNLPAIFDSEWNLTTSDDGNVDDQSAATPAGTQARLEVSFWSENALPQSGMISIALPSGAHVDHKRVACYVSVAGGAITAAVDVTKGPPFGEGDTLNMTVDAGIPKGQAVDVVCSNVFVRAWAGEAEYHVRSTTANGDVIDVGRFTTSVSPGALQGMVLNQTGYMAGKPNEIDVTFRTRNILPISSVVEIQVPSHFSIDMAHLSAEGSVNGTYQTFPTAATITSGWDHAVHVHLRSDPVPPNTEINIRLIGLLNRDFAGEANVLVLTRHPPKKYFEQETDRDFAIVDMSSAVVRVDPVAVTDAQVTPAESVAGSWLTLVVNYTLESPLPADGSVSIMFPPDYDLSRVSSTSCFLSGVDGVANVEVHGRNVSLSRFQGTTVAARTLIQVQLVNVQLPIFEDTGGRDPDVCMIQPASCFIMQTMTRGIRDPWSRSIDVALLAPVVTIRSALSSPGTPYSGSYRLSLPAGPGSVRVSPKQSRAGDLINLTVEFWTVNMVPSGGRLVLQLPSGFAVEVYSTHQCMVAVRTTASSSNQNLTVTTEVVNGTRIEITLADQLKESVSLSLVCSGIKVRDETGLKVQHHVYTSTADGHDRVIDSGYGYTDVVAGSLMPASVGLSTVVAGSQVSLHFSLSLTNKVPINGVIEIDLPPAFTPISPDFQHPPSSSGSFIQLNYGGHSWCYGLLHSSSRGVDSDSLPSHPQGLYTLHITGINCTLPSDVVVRFNVSGLRNRGWEGATGTFRVRTRTAPTPEGKLIDGCDEDPSSVHCPSETVAGSVLVPSSPTATSILLEVYTAGNEGRAIISFTTSTTFYNDSVVQMTFPVGFSLDPYAPLSGLYKGIDGMLDFQLEGQRSITIFRTHGTDLAPGTPVRIELAAVQNRKISDCSDVGYCKNSSGGVELRLATHNGVTTDVATIVLEKLDVALLEFTDIQPSALVAGSLGHVDVAFRLVNPLPGDGKIILDFPHGVALVHPLIVQTISGIDGLFAVSTSGAGRVIVDRVRGSLLHTGGLVQFNLTGVRNRVYSGLSGTYQIRTALHDGTLIDADLDVASDMLRPGTLQNVHIQPDSMTAGVTSKLTISFAVANPLPPDGGIEVQLPAGFVFPSSSVFSGGVLNGSYAARADPVQRTAYAISGSTGYFTLMFQDERTAILWRNGTNETLTPCNYSQPEFELRREVISPGCTGLDDLYQKCSIAFAVENITNRHVSGDSSIYRLRTLLADRNVVDEAVVDGHAVKHGQLLATSVDPASHIAGTRTTASVTMLATNGLPADGKVEVVFPEGFDVRGLSLGASTRSMRMASGAALVADEVPTFSNLIATTSSRVKQDSARVSVSFEMNFEADDGTKFVIGNLGTSITQSMDDYEGSDRDRFGPASWDQESGEIEILLKNGPIPAGQQVHLVFHLQNPTNDSTGVHPTIRSEPPEMKPFHAVFGGEKVLVANDTARSLISNISSTNGVPGGNITIRVLLQFNFALRQGHEVEISGLESTSTHSTSNLSLAGPSAESFKYGGWWNRTEGSLRLSVWESIDALRMIEIRFLLQTGPSERSVGVQPILRVQGAQASDVMLSEVTMLATDVLVATQALAFSVKTLGQNTAAFNALNMVTVTLRPNAALPSGTSITLLGLTGSQTESSEYLDVLGKDASIFKPTASWSRDSGTLIVQIDDVLRDDQDTVFHVWLRNPPTSSAGSTASIESQTPLSDMKVHLAPMDGVALRAEATGTFMEAAVSYSNSRAFARNQVHLSLKLDANLPAGSTVTVTKLPLDTESNATCFAETIDSVDCLSSFSWMGKTWMNCVTGTAPGVPSPLNQGLPWCPTDAGFLPALPTQLSEQNVSYIKQKRGVLWNYCRCDNQTSRQLWGQSARLFERDAAWDHTTSTLTLTVAVEQGITAGQMIHVSFWIRNPGVYVPSGVPEYLWARVASKVVDPYREVTCATVTIVDSGDLSQSMNQSLSQYVAQSIGQDAAGILVMNVTETTSADLSQREWFVEYCSFDANGYGNMYGISPMVEASEGDAFTTLRQVMDSQELIIRPHGCTRSNVGGDIDGTVSNEIKADPDPAWVLSALGIGESHYGAVTTITITLQPNWELDHPTQITICCLNGFEVPDVQDGGKIAVFNADARYFAYQGLYLNGSITLQVAAGMMVPCNTTSIFSVKLRNFRNRDDLGLPTNLTAMGPLGFFTSKLDTSAATMSEPKSFFWKHAHATDNSEAYGTLNMITVTIQPSQELYAPVQITIGNLLGSSSPTNRDPGFSPTAAHPWQLIQNGVVNTDGSNSFRFSKAEWVNDLDRCSSPNQLDCVDADARLILHINPTEFVPATEATVVSFYLRNKPFFVEGRVPTISTTLNSSINNVSVDSVQSGMVAYGPEFMCEPNDDSQPCHRVLGASAPAGFRKLSVSASTRVVGAMSTITVRMQPNWLIEDGTRLTLTGLSDSCPDSAAYFDPPAHCQNLQNPSDNNKPLQGASGAIFGDSGLWDHVRAILVLTAQQSIAAGDEIELKFSLRNKGVLYKGVRVGMKIPVYGSDELLDGVLTVRAARQVTVRRSGQGRAIQPGETMTFALQHIRVPGRAGPSGTYQLRTMLGDGTLLDEDLAVRETIIQPGRLEARLTMSPRTAGARGEVLVEVSTTNPVPEGGFIHVWFPDGFQLDTGHWDVIVYDDYIQGSYPLTRSSAGLHVEPAGDFTVHIGTAGTDFLESGLDRTDNWHTSAIVTNLGPELPAAQRWNFTLKGVQFPMASKVRAVGGSGGNETYPTGTGTFQVRTYTEKEAVIDEDLDVPGEAYFDAGSLLHSSVRPSSLVAGSISDLIVSFVTFNPLTADARIELTLPEGFAFAGDANHRPRQGSEAVGPWSAHYGLDYMIRTSPSNPSVTLPVGSTRARQLAVEILDESIEGNLTLSVHDSRRCTFWRSGKASVQRHTRVRFRVFDPTVNFPVTAPVLGVRNPTVSGTTGTFELRVRLNDGTLLDQDLAVPAIDIVPATLSNVHVGPTDATAGALSDLRISFAVTNPLPVDSSFRVTLPFQDVTIATSSTPIVSGQDALENSSLAVSVDRVNVTVQDWGNGDASVMFSEETVVLTRTNAATTVAPCVKPVCGDKNIVSTAVDVPAARFQSSWKRPPSYAAYAFAADGTSWVSGPSPPHWVQYDFGQAVSVCSYAFQSRPSDVLGYLRADGPTSYKLLGSLDGTTFTTLHEVKDGQEWTSGKEERVHPLHTNSHFRYFRLEVSNVPGRLTGNKYTVIRNLRLMAPTGADPHLSRQETQCIVSVVIRNFVRNRHFEGLTKPYKVATYDSSGRVIDEQPYGQGTYIEPGMLLDGAVVPSSMGAGEVVTMKVSFTPVNDIPKNGHIEVVFPKGVDLSGMDTSGNASHPRIFNESEIFNSWGPGEAKLVVRVTGQAVQVIRDNNGDVIPAKMPLSLSLRKIRNIPYPGIGGTYAIRCKAHESLMDSNESVAGTNLTTARVQNLTLDLPSDVAGGMGPVRVSFVPSNPIPPDGRVHITLPEQYVLLHPLHAVWLEGADGFISTTVEDDGSILLSRDGEFEAPRHVRQVLEFSTVINVPRSGDTLTFQLCTLLHDRRPVDCAPPQCAGCHAETSKISPRTLQPAALINASVMPTDAVTGNEGLLVSFTTVNALRANSVLHVMIPKAFQVGSMSVSNFSFDHAACYQSNNPPNNTAAPVALPEAPLVPTNMTVSVDSSLADHHNVSIHLPSLVRASSVFMNVRGVRNPLWRGQSGTFQLTIRDPDTNIVDRDLDLPSVYIRQGQLVSASVNVDRFVAGDMIALFLRFASAKNPIPAWGYIDITLPSSFYACPCSLTQDLSGEPMRCAQVGCEPGNEIRPDFVEVLSDGTRRLNVGNLTYKAVDSNGTLIRLRPQHDISGVIELEVRNVRGQNFSGPTGTFQIQTRTQSGELIDENLAIPGYTLLTAGPKRLRDGVSTGKGGIADTRVTVMDPTAGRRGRLLVEFTPYNPLPPSAKIALVLPTGFHVSDNSSVAQPVGNHPSEENFYIQEWDKNVSLDGELEVHVHGDVQVSVSRKGSTSVTPPGTRAAFFLDVVRNPPRSGMTGTFQVRTLLSSGVAIDEDLEVPGVWIAPGNFTGVCPPFCALPEVRPTSLLAGSIVNLSVAFHTSNGVPADGQIEVKLHPNAYIVSELLVSAGSVLDGSRTTVEQVGPVLDGGLIVFLQDRTVRIRRDGTGRRIEVGEMVSLTIQGLQNQMAQGNTGVANLMTKERDGVVIDDAEIPGHVLSPVQFEAFDLSKDVLTAGKTSTMLISLATSGPIQPGSRLIVYFSDDALLALNPSSLELDTASWKLSIEDGVRLVLLYQDPEAIAGGVMTTLSVSNVPNPSVAKEFEYKMSLVAPESSDSTDVYRSFEYEVGGLSEVKMTPESLQAGFVGVLQVSFRILNALPADAIIEIELPGTFAFSDPVEAEVEAQSQMQGTLDVTRTSATHVSLQRVHGEPLGVGGRAEIALVKVRNQEFSGSTPQMKVTTRTADGLLIDTGRSDPITLSVASLGNASVTFDFGVIASVESATVRFKTGSPIPPDGQVLMQLPPGTEVFQPPKYMSFMGLPVRVTLYPGTPASSDARLYVGGSHFPYFSFNETHALPPAPMDDDVLRGASVLLSRLGAGGSIPAESEVVFVLPGVKLRPWSGFSGKFQLMTMLSTFELIDEDQNVNGVTLHPNVFPAAAIAVSSLVSGESVRISVNFTLSVPLPPTAEIHITFPAGYRGMEFASVVSHQGLTGVVEPFGIVSAVGGATVLKLSHECAHVTPGGTDVFLVLAGIENRFFSSRAQYFQLDTYMADGVTHLESSVGGVPVPLPSDSSRAPGFGVVVETDLVMIFDAHDPSQAARIVTLEEGTGSVTHGVSAMDRSGDVVYFVAGGLLLALELASPSLVTVPLQAGGESVLGFVSMEWDVVRQQLVGLALIDGEVAICGINTVSGAVTRLADFSACGACECSPSQGVSALDSARGVYYAASQVLLMAVNVSSGAVISQTSVVQGEDGFLGFASLEFDGQGHHPRFEPLGLLGVTLRGDKVELVQINPDTGAMHTRAEIFDDVFTGQIVGGISALSPGHTHYMLLAHSRLLAVDLDTGVVSYSSPYAAGVSSAWAFLEMSRFLEPLEEFVPVHTGGGAASLEQLPADVSELDISVLGLNESLPVKRGAVDSGHFFAVTLVGADVAPGHRVQVSPAGDCGAVLPGGGPFAITSASAHHQRFFLDLQQQVPGAAQLCYSRPDGFDAAFRPLPYAGAPGSWLVQFPTTMAFFSVDHDPIPVGTTVPLTLVGALAAGDTLRIVANDGSLNAADLCTHAPLYPGTEPVSIVTIDPQQRREYAFGTVTEITADLQLDAAGASELAVCYRAAASGSFAMISGQQRANDASPWRHGVLMAVAAGDAGDGGQVCDATAPQDGPDQSLPSGLKTGSASAAYSML